MPLKSLTLNGFKSFADKTKIEFTSGITGIVGPNGSGKSNIIEGIRWVMGEQSAKNLRGDKMTDVIFAGSSIRPSMNRAEVIFEFNNSNHDLKSKHDEVIIKRRLFRDGTSEFSINNKKCRLKDVTELFLDSGLGRESFSIISQGRVEAIFNSKPTERRSIIEESAGVALYKQKKHDAELKLVNTDDNLNRVSDILHELSIQVEPLKQQASIAHDYLQQKKEYDNIYKKTLAIEIFELNQVRKKRMSEVNILKEKAIDIDKKVENNSSLISKNRNKITDLSKEIDENNSRLLNLSKELEKLNGKKAISEERNLFNKKNKQQLIEQIDEFNNNIKELKSELASANNEYEKFKNQEQDLSNQLNLVNSKIDKTPEKLNIEIEQIRSEYLNELQEQTTANNNINFLETQKNRILNLNENTQSNIVSKNQELSIIETNLDELKIKINDFKNNNSELTQKFQLQKEKREELQTKLEINRTSLMNSLSQLNQAKAKYKALTELSKDHAGFYQGVKAILNNKSAVKGIVGAVVELIKVPKTIEIAIEVAAGNQLQSIVTDDEFAAKQAISYLRKENLGRATFLPKDVIKSRKIADSKLANLTSPNFLGIASELLSYSDDNKNIMENIFGNLLITKDLDTAIDIAKTTNHKYRIVTLQGDILNPGGSLTGGRIRRSGSNILNRNQELDDIQKSINELEKKNSNFELIQKKLVEEIQIIDSNIKTSSDLIAKYQNNKNEFLQEYDHLTIEKNRIIQEIKLLEKSSNDNQSELSKVILDIDDNKEKLISINEELSKLKTLTIEKNNLLENFDQQQSILNERISTLKTQISVNNNNLENKSLTIRRLNNEIIKEENNLSEFNKKLQKISLEQKDLSKNNNDDRILEISGEIKKLTIDIDDLKNKRKLLEVEFKKLTELSDANYQLQKNISDQQENASINLTKINNQINIKLEILREDYKATFESVYDEIDTQKVDVDALNKKLRMLKMSISELGNVNVSAIEEYDKVKDRYEFLNQQQNDLITARAQLKKIMFDMDEEVADRFEKTFNKVAASFEVIFPDMFAGGKAKLMLTDPNNMLETGIEIVAQPPGKKFQKLSLLSGGEKALTAIALLFAIIRVNPVPFCILDEVEAALDDTNVYRFAKYLNRYDKDTQFIVITHRKGTMMNVNRLYGVSMEELGISKMVSVEVKENNG